MRSHTRLAGATGVVVLSVLLAACGGSNSTHSGSMPSMGQAATTSPAPASSVAAATPAEAEHNDADVFFTQNMIVHHQGAIAMARLAASRSSTTQVKDLAARVEAAQSPEITQMREWLRTWGEPATPDATMTGMNHPDDAQMGMMSTQQMNTLHAAKGKSFDRMFLRMMSAHHQGAITMAATEQTQGSNPQAMALAATIKTSQTAELTQMKQMMTTL